MDLPTLIQKIQKLASTQLRRDMMDGASQDTVQHVQKSGLVPVQTGALRDSIGALNVSPAGFDIVAGVPYAGAQDRKHQFMPKGALPSPMMTSLQARFEALVKKALSA